MKTFFRILLFLLCLPGNITFVLAQKSFQNSYKVLFSPADSSNSKLRRFIVSSIISRQQLFGPDFLDELPTYDSTAAQIENVLEVLRSRFPSGISNPDELLIKDYINSLYELSSLARNALSDLCGRDSFRTQQVKETRHFKDSIPPDDMKYRISEDYLNLFKRWIQYDASKQKSEIDWHNRIIDMYNFGWESINDNLNNELRIECEKLKHEHDKELAKLQLKVASKGDAIKLSFTRTTRTVLKRKQTLSFLYKK